MSRELTKGDVRRLLELTKEGEIASSRLSEHLAKELLREEVVIEISKGRGRKFRLINNDALGCFLSQRYGINKSIEELSEAYDSDSRSEQVVKGGDSKLNSIRTFNGFLVNSYTAIKATLAGKELIINPQEGTCVYIEDWQHFEIPEDVEVIGMENGENFFKIREQRYLFEGQTALFVSRYPQSSDLRNWLKQIPNQYIHFGDIDLAGINIYLTEYYCLFPARCKFFIPDDIEERFKEGGNRERYDKQYEKYSRMEIADERLNKLVALIHQYRMGYDQEGYIPDKS